MSEARDKTISITIDGKKVDVEQGQTVLDGAKKLGIDIPTMCYHDGSKYFTSCMMCLVKDNRTGKTIPGCSAEVQVGMDITSRDEEVFQARRQTLDLLLSEHVGDCEAPCTRICPTSMNIPLMLRQFQEDKPLAAIATVRQEIPFPSSTCRLCPAPCEGGCRRGKYDTAISIRNASAHTGDISIRENHPWVPEIPPDTGKKIAIVGGGASGLAAAYYLRLDGHEIHLFEKESKLGGSLRNTEIEGKRLGHIVDGELKVLDQIGVHTHAGRIFGADLVLGELTETYDAICLNFGKPQDLDIPGLEIVKGFIQVKGKTSETSIPGVFASGNAVKKSRMPIQSVLTAKNMRVSVNQFLKGQAVVGPADRFNSAMGKLLEGEVGLFADSVSKDDRVAASLGDIEGYTAQEVKEESERCLHCDCRKNESCYLREYSTEYTASQARYRGGGRPKFTQYRQETGVVFEPGKCLKCGVCVRIAENNGEEFGLTFIGRGFDIKVGVPLSASLGEGLKKTAEEVVKNCPTGALSFFDHDEKNSFD